MKFTFRWLKELVDFGASPERLAETLTMAGFEVESLARMNGAGPGDEDWLFDVAVTPNRGDCLGVLGLARETAVILGRRLKKTQVSPHGKERETRGAVSVKIANRKLCARYGARVVGGLRVARSPAWLERRLEACGIRPLNNVVDVTNYVMLETGQPLHAFDLDRLRSRRVVVREAGTIKTLRTLDGAERSLEATDLLICDGDEPVALAGIMGGAESEVSAATRSVLLEAARFDPRRVRRTARRLGLRTEASHRFERGVDPEGIPHALDRAVFLIESLSGGAALKGMADQYPGRRKNPAIALELERVRALLGVEIGPREIERVLAALGVKTARRAARSLTVRPPSYRPDLVGEADLIEEVVRLYGYDKIPATMPPLRPSDAATDARLSRERSVRSYFIGEGLHEIVHLPFTSERLNEIFTGVWPARRRPVRVLNPIAQDATELRLSLLPGLVASLRVNLQQQAESFLAFDLGKVFSAGAQGEAREGTMEEQRVGGLLYGPRPRAGLRRGDIAPFGFLDAKGLVEGLLEVLNCGQGAHWWAAGVPEFLHPGKSAAIAIDGTPLGYLGEAHPDLRRELDLPPVFFFELDFEKSLQYAPPKFKLRSLPRFPAVERDLAIVADEEFPAQRVMSWIQDNGPALAENVKMFDVYSGASIPTGKKSLAYSIAYRAEDRTLTDEEVNAMHEDLIARLTQSLGIELRR